MASSRPSEYRPVTKTYNFPAYLYGRASAAIISPDVHLQVLPTICEDVTKPPACKGVSLDIENYCTLRLFFVPLSYVKLDHFDRQL